MINATPRATRLAVVTTAGLLALGGLSACSDDTDDPTTTTSQGSTDNHDTGGSGDEGGEDAPGTNQSRAVFDAYTPHKPVGSTTNKDGVKFDVFAVKDASGVTDLTFQLTSHEESAVSIAGNEWDQYPTLVTKGSDTALQPLTVNRPREGNLEKICVCSAQVYISQAPKIQHVLYQQLPDNVSKVEIRYKGFKPITVKITD